MDKRIERDSLGEIEVDNDKYWGAQTQRSFMNFPKGLDLMPKEEIRALTLIKKAASIVNFELGKIDEERKISLFMQQIGFLMETLTTNSHLQFGKQDLVPKAI